MIIIINTLIENIVIQVPAIRSDHKKIYFPKFNVHV